MLPLVVSIHLWRGQPLLVGEHTIRMILCKAHGFFMFPFLAHPRSLKRFFSALEAGWGSFRILELQFQSSMIFSCVHRVLRTVQVVKELEVPLLPNFFLIIPLVQPIFLRFWQEIWRYCGSTWRVFGSFFCSPGHWSQELGTMDPGKAARGWMELTWLGWSDPLDGWNEDSSRL